MGPPPSEALASVHGAKEVCEGPSERSALDCLRREAARILRWVSMKPWLVMASTVCFTEERASLIACKSVSKREGSRLGRLEAL